MPTVLLSIAGASMLVRYRLAPGEKPRYRGGAGDAYDGSEAAVDIIAVARRDGGGITPEQADVLDAMLDSGELRDSAAKEHA